MNNSVSYIISKSKYIDGIRCLKLLWNEYHRKDYFDEADAGTQAIFDQGHIVGRLAQSLFPGGVELERERSPAKQMEKSWEAIKLRKPVFETGFLFNNLYAMPDILNPVGKDEWDLIEVKSSTEVKEQNISDIAFQRYVYEGAGLKIRKCFLMHIDNTYIRKGNIDPKQLFAKEDITKECVDLVPKIKKNLKNMFALLNSKNEPVVKVGSHCDDPWACALCDKCWSFLPEKNSVFSLYRGRAAAYDLMDKGILDITKIPGDFKLSDKQTIQFQTHITGTPHVDKEQIKAFLDTLEYPLYFLDFETINPAIPVYDNTRPFEAIPFQYSLYIMKVADSKPERHGYIAPDKNDSRKEILKQLKALLGSKGSIVAYNSGFEIGNLRRASEAYLEYGDWFNSIEKRFVDLLVPFRSFHYYHPKQEGSASLKAVLPILSKMNYKNIEINEGGLASNEYFRVTFGENVDKKDRDKVHKALTKYCDIDTMGMIEIVRALNRLCR